NPGSRRKIGPDGPIFFEPEQNHPPYRPLCGRGKNGGCASLTHPTNQVTLMPPSHPLLFLYYTQKKAAPSGAAVLIACYQKLTFSVTWPP
ncbi:hypothetical protein ACN1VD_003026, partial [Cronobacter malonaticus]